MVRSKYSYLKKFLGVTSIFFTGFFSNSLISNKYPVEILLCTNDDSNPYLGTYKYETTLDMLINDGTPIRVTPEDSFEFYIPLRHYLRKKSDRHSFVTIDSKIDPDDYYVSKLSRLLIRHKSSVEERAQAILDFVNSNISYSVFIEEGGYDYVKHPVETLVERTGDCEDTSILAVSMMRSVGIDAHVFIIESPSYSDSRSSHAIVGVPGNFYGARFKIGGKFYYLGETAARNPVRFGYINKKFFGYKLLKVIPEVE